jgi:fermentation-respiration switch protein FrsA (DUF1100 family)
MTPIARPFIFPGCDDCFPDQPTLERLVPGARLVDYPSSDGLVLRGLLRVSGRKSSPVVLYFHGNADSAAQNLDLALGLSKQGIDTFLAEYRGYGGMAGSPSESGLYEDAAAAIATLEREGISRERVVIVGRSLGSGVAVEMARRGHGRAVVLLSPYTSLVDVARRFVGPMAPALVWDKFDSLSKIGEVNAPIAVLHGTEDGVIPCDLGRTLARATPRARFIPLPGLGHNDLGDLSALVILGLREVAPELLAAPR